jgi:hypothetical protein
MTTLRNDVDRWVDAGLIDRESADAIERFERSREPSERRIPLVAEAVGYLGATLASAAVVTVLSDQWDRWTDATRLGVAAAGAVLALGIGWITRRNPEPALQRFTAVMWALSAGAALGAGVVLGEEILGLDNADAVMLGGGVGLGVAVPTYLTRSRAPTQLAVLVTGMVALMGFLEAWLSQGQPETGAIMAMAGVVWLAGGWAGILRPERFARLAGTAITFMGAMGMYDGTDAHAWALLLGIALAIGAVGISVLRAQPELTGLGIVGLFLFLLAWVQVTFEGTLGVPLALLVAGGLAIGAALLLTRRMRSHPRL